MQHLNMFNITAKKMEDKSYRTINVYINGDAKLLHSQAVNLWNSQK